MLFWVISKSISFGAAIINMLILYTTLIITDNPSYNNASCVVFHADEAEWKIELRQGEEDLWMWFS